MVVRTLVLIGAASLVVAGCGERAPDDQGDGAGVDVRTGGWPVSAGGFQDDLGKDVAVLSDGSALVTGLFETIATFGAGEANETILTTAGSEDIFLARYKADGTLAWARDFDNVKRTHQTGF